jgi:hypothetical protein
LLINYPLAAEQQNDIGWQAMAKGWTAEEWAVIQQEYYKLIGSRKTWKRYLVEIIKKLWLITWDMWEHRNSILHNTENVHSQTQEAYLNKKMCKLYSPAMRYLAHSPDNYLLGIPISNLIRKSYAYKKNWANTAEIAILWYKE